MEVVDKKREHVLVAARSWAESIPGKVEALEKIGVTLLSDSDIKKFCLERDGDTMNVYTATYEDGSEVKKVLTIHAGLLDWE